MRSAWGPDLLAGTQIVFFDTRQSYRAGLSAQADRTSEGPAVSLELTSWAH
jgi:hypothetical protein